MAIEVVTGSRFGKLIVLREGQRVPNGAKTARGIVVRCECGSDEFVTNINNLRSGRTTSCGCAKRAAAAKIAADQKGKTREEIQSGRQAGLEGQVFGKLSVVEDRGNLEGYRAYRCECSCGEETVVAAYRLLDDKGPRSCGCLQRETVTRHGMEGTRIYDIWQGMRARCRDPKDLSYERYGARGITVCERWYSDFAVFYADMGDPPTQDHTLERKENDGNYEPGNCRWASRKEQANNTRSNVHLTLNGVTHTAAEWSELTGINAATIRGRKRSGWSDERTLTEPADMRFATR